MTGERVLVVEDNEKNMKLFRDVLIATGFRTLEATTGGDAVDMASEHTPDLVLMDIQLPDIDGVQALHRLRADARTATIPVLALTAQAMRGDRERFLAEGFDGYVSKPVNVRELIRIVRAALRGTARMSDEGRILGRGRRSSQRAAARGRARAARLRRHLRDRRGARARARRVGQAGPGDARCRDAAAGRVRGVSRDPGARGHRDVAGDT